MNAWYEAKAHISLQFHLTHLSDWILQNTSNILLILCVLGLVDGMEFHTILRRAPLTFTKLKYTYYVMLANVVKMNAHNWWLSSRHLSLIEFFSPSRTFKSTERAYAAHRLYNDSPYKAINNHNGHTDIYVTVMWVRNEAFKSEGNLCAQWLQKKVSVHL